MRNVLIVTGANLGRGGVQAYLMKWFSAAERDAYKFTWYFPGKILAEEYAEQFKNMGIKIIPAEITDLPPKQRYRRFFCELDELMSENVYDIVHINTGAIKYQYYAIRAAVKNKIAVRIAHSHSAVADESRINKLKNDYFRCYLRRNATVCAGCSSDAGAWLFGERIIFNEKWRLIKNTINPEQFLFHKAVREEKRNELGIGDECLLISVGNMNRVKNQSFLIDVMTCLKEMPYKTKLIIIGGDGTERKALESKAVKQGVADNVIFYGVSDCVNEWLQAADILLMPSLYEGFGIAALEGQAAGLPCLLSDRITREVKVMDDVKYLPIDNRQWVNAIADVIERYKQGRIEREADIEMLQKACCTDDCIANNIDRLYKY